MQVTKKQDELLSTIAKTKDGITGEKLEKKYGPHWARTVGALEERGLVRQKRKDLWVATKTGSERASTPRQVRSKPSKATSKSSKKKSRAKKSSKKVTKKKVTKKKSAAKHPKKSARKKSASSKRGK